MELTQAHLFYIFILTGILLGVLFDVFRILRKSFKTSDLITYIEDVVFWILAGFLLFYTVYKFNNGEIRSYVLLGIALGLTAYLIIFSKIFIKINVSIIVFVKNICIQIAKLMLYPLKLILNLLRKLFLKPISFIFINIRKNMTTLFTKASKIHLKFPKKAKQKEGF